MTTALVIIIDVDTEASDVVTEGISKLLEASKTQEKLTDFLSTTAMCSILREVPDFRKMSSEPFKLWTHCAQFINNQCISCAKDIARCENVMEHSYEFIEKVCDIVGYWKDEETSPKKAYKFHLVPDEDFEEQP